MKQDKVIAFIGMLFCFIMASASRWKYSAFCFLALGCFWLCRCILLIFKKQ